MLISRRKEGETVFVGDDIEIRIVEVTRTKVVLGIIAPREIRITAGKLNDVEMANTRAAVNAVNIGRLLGQPQPEREAVMLVLESVALREARE